jgi:hypothetical protein
MSTKRLNIETLKQEAIKRGGKLISEVYINSKTNLEWECSKGHHWMTNWDHIKRGHWCLYCSRLKKPDIQILKDKALEFKGELISNTYVNNRQKLTWKCQAGHKWDAPWSSVSRGSWCPKCYGNAKSEVKTLSDLAEKNKGTLIQQQITNTKQKIQWKCSNGHIFHMRANNVQQGQWCPKCLSRNTSKAQLEIMNWLELQVGSGAVLYNTKPLKDGKKKLELDLYLPDHKLAIEYHGLAHHSMRPVFKEKDPINLKKQHKIKYQLCKEQNIQLIQIFEDEWRDKSEILKSMISHKLGKTINSIPSRKCEIKEVVAAEASEFFSKNHINGNTQSITTYGLYYENSLVCALSLRKPFTQAHPNHIEIARFATILNTKVVGGFQKLLKAVKDRFQNQYDGILTYADLRFGDGNVYLQSGFEFIGTTEPNYYYERAGVRENRFKHRKNNDPSFISLFGNTELEQNSRQGWYRIYDAGSHKFKLSLI